MDDTSYTKIGYYQILSIISDNGRSKVFHGFEESFEGDAAVKVYPRDFWSDPQFKARFEHAMQVINLIDHPVIVPVYDLGETDGRPYVAMRFMKGGSLANRLRKGPLPVSEAYHITYQISLALEAAHQNKIVHNDLKPENILFDEEGEPFLSDFYSYRTIQLDDASAVFNYVYGTPATMSPELAVGKIEVDNRSDIYALGAIVYQMLTGQTPFEGKTPAQTAINQVTSQVPNVREINASLPAGCEQLIYRAMAKNPAERYSSAIELAEAFLAILEGRELLPASPVKSKEEIAKPVSSARARIIKRAVFGCGAVLLIILCVLAILLGAWIKPTQLSARLAEKILAYVFPSTATTPVIITHTQTAAPPTVTSTFLPLEIIPTLPNVVVTPFLAPTPIEFATPGESPTPTKAPIPIKTHPQAGGADKIAFLNDYEVWMANLDGSDLQLLTSDKQPKTDLKWTSEGLSYVTNGTTVQINGVEPGGASRVQELKTTQYRGRLTRISWDGRYIATIQEYSLNNRIADGIVVYDHKGEVLDTIPGERFTISGYSGLNDTPTLLDYGWNGDEFFALHGDIQNGFGDLLIYNMKTHIHKKVNPLDGQCCYKDMQFSPDGTYILFVFRDIRYEKNPQIYYVPFGTLESGISDPPLNIPETYFYKSNLPISPVLHSVLTSVVADLPQATSTVDINVTPQPTPTRGAAPVFPGGADKIAVVNNGDIWIANLDGSDLLQITTDGSDKGNLSWTPDGQAVIYSTTGCWKAARIDTREVISLGCFDDYSISALHQEVIVSKYIQTSNETTLLKSFRSPFNLTRLSYMSDIFQFQTMGGYQIVPGMDFHWSKEGTKLAGIFNISSEGYKGSEVKIYAPPLSYQEAFPLDSFPASRFTMRGYNDDPEKHFLLDFGWNGVNLFALHGDVINGFGDMLIYDSQSGKFTLLNPAKMCCYQDIEWSPDGTYLLFTFQVGSLTQVYYLPYDSLENEAAPSPIQFPNNFFSSPLKRVWPTVRSAIPAYSPLPAPPPTVESDEITPVLSETHSFTDWTNAVAFSNDNTWLATASSNLIQLWNIPEKKYIRAFQGISAAHTETVNSLAFSPDGKFIASGSADNTIIIWWVKDGTPKIQIKGHTGAVNGIAFSPGDGRYLASGSNDNTARVWISENSAQYRVFTEHTGVVTSVAFSPDGKLIASASADKTVKIWQIEDMKVLLTLRGHTRPVWSVAFSPDGQTIASGSWDGTVKLWRVTDGTLLRTLVGHQDGVESVAFSLDGKYLVSGSDDKTVKVWRVSDGVLLRTLADNKEGILSVAISPDGRTIAAGGYDEKVFLWGLTYK